MRTWNELSINEKIQIKQRGINVYGKRYHVRKPDFWKKLNELEINMLLSY